MRFIFILLSFLCFQLVVAQNSLKPQPVLWKIESPNSSSISYILGTDHLFGREWFDKFPEIKDKIRETEFFFSETGKADGKDLISNARLSPKRFSDLVGKDSSRIDSFFAAYMKAPFIPSKRINELDDLNRQREFIVFLYGWVQLKYHKELLGLPASGSLDEDMSDFTSSLDGLFEAYADSIGLKVHGLDDPSYIREHIIDNGAVTPDLISTIKTLSDFKNHRITKEIKRSQEHLQLYNLGMMPGVGSFKAKRREIDWVTNVARNKSWVKQLSDSLRTNNCFIVVGRDHLFLNKRYGVLDLLKKKGFKISSVSIVSAF